MTVRARPGRLSALGVSHSKLVFYGAFVWVRRALNGRKQRCLARAVPVEKTTLIKVGLDTSGNRIAFDLGKSDVKVRRGPTGFRLPAWSSCWNLATLSSEACFDVRWWPPRTVR
jgi:hypothetical protein